MNIEYTIPLITGEVVLAAGETQVLLGDDYGDLYNNAIPTYFEAADCEISLEVQAQKIDGNSNVPLELIIYDPEDETRFITLDTFQPDTSVVLYTFPYEYIINGETVYLDAGFVKITNGNGGNTYRITNIQLRLTFTDGTLPTIAVSGISNNASYGTVSGGNTFTVEDGHTVYTTVLTATPSNGYHFTAWSDGDTSNPRTVSVSNADCTGLTTNISYTANFSVGSAHTFVLNKPNHCTAHLYILGASNTTLAHLQTGASGSVTAHVVASDIQGIQLGWSEDDGYWVVGINIQVVSGNSNTTYRLFDYSDIDADSVESFDYADYSFIDGSPMTFIVTMETRRSILFSEQNELGNQENRSAYQVYVQDAQRQNGALVRAIYVQQPNQTPQLVYEDVSVAIARLPTAQPWPNTDNGV